MLDINCGRVKDTTEINNAATMFRMLMIACVLAINTAANAVRATADAEYHVGAGIWDITGPAADVNMMGPP